jgi:cation diffusion facilitator family transporter
MIKPSWTIVDPICTVFFSALVMFTTYRLVWDSLGILMEGTPTHIDPEEIEASLLKIPGVTLVHDLHVWNLTAGKVGMSNTANATTPFFIVIIHHHEIRVGNQQDDNQPH